MKYLAVNNSLGAKAALAAISMLIFAKDITPVLANSVQFSGIVDARDHRTEASLSNTIYTFSQQAAVEHFPRNTSNRTMHVSLVVVDQNGRSLTAQFIPHLQILHAGQTGRFIVIVDMGGLSSRHFRVCAYDGTNVLQDGCTAYKALSVGY